MKVSNTRNTLYETMRSTLFGEKNPEIKLTETEELL